MAENVRVRFAPSPTGFLHIGGARTALFNWLFARHHKGAFVLRIEDTDKSRSTGASIQAIIDSMNWLSLNWDEGPFRQTERFEIYQSMVDKLLEKGNAYYCYCLQEELVARRKEALQKGMPPKYDRRCRDKVGSKPHGNPVIRFKNPLEGRTIVEDLIKGKIVFDNKQLDDFIILRSDGTPTYNFVVVVDDVEMNITHVIRGDDHLNNTPKQIQIYKALGYKIPYFAHLPMILGTDKTRLSKRHGAVSVMAYREMGYLPDALVNYLVRLGWSYGDQEVFSRTELIEKFSLENVGKASAVFNPEKLLWLNSLYINQRTSKELVEPVKAFLLKEGIIHKNNEPDEKWLCKAIDTLKERSQNLKELTKGLNYYIAHEIVYDPKARKKFLNKKTLSYLNDVKTGITTLEPFDAQHIEKLFYNIVQKEAVKLGSVAQPVRVAVTGGTASPGIFEVLEIMGKERVIERLDKAIEVSKVN